MIITTKCWEKDWRTTLDKIKENPAYHFGEELWLVVNNMVTDISEEAMAVGVNRFIVAEAFIDDAEKYYKVRFEENNGRKYSISELVELYLIDGKYIHYASDVIPPPEREWLEDAERYLKDYDVVTPDWDSEGCDKKLTDFGFTDYSFSDQCYAVDADKFKPDFNAIHPIGDNFPEHGGDSFEKRVAMYLADKGEERAVLSKYHFRHIDSRFK